MGIDWNIRPALASFDPMGSFMKGYLTPIEAQKIGMQTGLLQEELQKRKDIKAAMSSMGPNGNPAEAVNRLWPVDPEMAVKVQTAIRSANKDQIESLKAAAELTEKLGPSLYNNPEQYEGYRQVIGGLGLGAAIPPITNFVGQDGQLDMNAYNKHIKNIVAMKDMVKEQAKAQFEPPKYHYMPTQDEQGNAILNRVNERTGTVDQVPVQGYKQGMTQEVTLPDGTTMKMSSGGKQTPAATGLTPKTQGAIEERLIGATDTMRMLTDIIPAMDKEFLTYQTQIGQWFDKQQEKLGIPLSIEAQEKKTKYTQFFAKAKNMHSTILKNLSGMAVTAAEEERIKAFTINPEKDSYTEAKAKLNNLKTDTESVIARTNYIRKNGISAQNAPQNIKQIMSQRRDAIAAEEKAKGLSPEQITANVEKRLNDEFFNPAARIGLVQ